MFFFWLLFSLISIYMSILPESFDLASCCCCRCCRHSSVIERRGGGSLHRRTPTPTRCGSRRHHAGVNKTRRVTIRLLLLLLMVMVMLLLLLLMVMLLMLLLMLMMLVLEMVLLCLVLLAVDVIMLLLTTDNKMVRFWGGLNIRGSYWARRGRSCCRTWGRWWQQ